MKIILDRDKATREEWLALHDQHIGGSDAGAVMNLSKYRTPMSTYVTKKGLLPHQEENEYMRWGNLLEDLIRREFVKDFREREKKDIHVERCSFMYESPVHSFMCCDPDGFITIDDHGGERRGLLEIKTTTRARAKEWKDDSLPDDVFAQDQHGMCVLDLSFALTVCLMDKHLFWRHVPRKEIFIREMIKIEKNFWVDFFLKNLMPGPSGEDVDTDLLLELYPRQEDVTVDLGQMPEVAKYLQNKEQIDLLKKEQELMKQRIIGLMGPAHRAVAGEHSVTRVTFNKSIFDLNSFRRDHPRLVEKYTGSTRVDFPRIS